MQEVKTNKIIKRDAWWLNVLAVVLIPTIFLLTMEWIHRGTLLKDFWSECFAPHWTAFFLEWLFLLFVYLLFLGLTGRHWPAVLASGFISNIPGAVTWFKLQMRGEPFLPWDFSQIEDLMGVADKVKLKIEPSMLWTLGIFMVLFIGSFWIRTPYKTRKSRIIARICTTIGAAFALCVLVFCVYLQPSVTQKMGIHSDMWMQDRYYRNHGVITGFITNLVVLNIAQPEGYSEEAAAALRAEVVEKQKTQKPLFENSYAAVTEQPQQTPNIIYVMNESFWDVSKLQGITYDRELTPTLATLKNEGAYGLVYSPSFGGGTCDVEFEALTGFSIEHLPSGAKPYQQYVTKDMPSLPQYLKTKGYETLAIHGYNRKFWSRNTAYPNLGLDTFIASEDFVNPDKKRGFISDAAMTQRIIEEYEKRTDDAPLFIHAVTMQNHTTYDASRYPENELVKIIDNAAGLDAETLSQLQDFATGVYEADAALGTLIDYFRNVDEPTVIVFWGDHFNPVGTGYELYEKTGWIQKGDHNSPALRGTDLRIWSNYDAASVDIGTIASYNLSPVVLDLYGIEKPLWFEFLTQQMPIMRARTHGVTVNPDGTYSAEMTPEQQASFDAAWLLQYDKMFGKNYTHAIATAKKA
ncbi:MAG: LTA synthase family protein [Ruthenibacterium sp.]